MASNLCISKTYNKGGPKRLVSYYWTFIRSLSLSTLNQESHFIALKGLNPRNTLLFEIETYLKVLSDKCKELQELKHIPSVDKRIAIYQLFDGEIDRLKRFKRIAIYQLYKLKRFKEQRMIVDFDCQFDTKYQNLEGLLAMKEEEDECSLEERTVFFINSVVHYQKAIHIKYMEFYLRILRTATIF